MKLLYLKYELANSVKFNPSQIRGFFSNKFPDKNLFHQYDEDGENIYRYPRIQYKKDKDKPFIVGIEEGVDLLIETFNDIDEIRLGRQNYEIMGKEILLNKDVEFGITENMIEYSFIYPWLALNQENYKNYNRYYYEKQRELLKKILIGNVLSMSKGLGYWVDDEIKVEINVRPVKIKLLIEEDILGFKGSFRINFILPNFIGLGKQVAKGWGSVIKKIDKNNTEGL
ncbi:hypothetical protein JXI42_11365 [bacterium]|nr:hypothetical protein [bacterium]